MSAALTRARRALIDVSTCVIRWALTSALTTKLINTMCTATSTSPQSHIAAYRPACAQSPAATRTPSASERPPTRSHDASCHPANGGGRRIAAELTAAGRSAGCRAAVSCQRYTHCVRHSLCFQRIHQPPAVTQSVFCTCRLCPSSRLMFSVFPAPLPYLHLI